MKRLQFFLLFACVATSVFAAKLQPVTSIEPPYWWTGMANDTLQLFIYGNDVKNAEMTVDYPGVSIASVADLDGSADYKVVYLTVGKETRPGTMTLSFVNGKQKQKVAYELKERTWDPASNPGFDASDVLYLIMPDRFSDGDTSNNDLPAAMKKSAASDRKDGIGDFRYRMQRGNENAARQRNADRRPGNMQMRNQTRGTGADRSRPGARHGGDISGIRNHLDYITDLGVTAIWVNPVQTNNQPGGSYHGYATTDYYNIDPRFGSNDEWREFVADAHSRGLKVVMDMIFNHCGSEHIWMKKFPSTDWFNHQAEFEADGSVVNTSHRKATLHDPYGSKKDYDRMVNGWFTRGMPDLNQLNRHLMNYLIQNSIFWIEDSHIDGIRMDTYPYADKDAMARWVDEVEREYPHFNIVGECWYGNDSANSFWQRDSKVNGTDPRLKTVMDFTFATRGNRYFFDQTGNGEGGGGLNNVYEHLATDFLYPDPSHILTFLDNHDTDRFLRKQPENLGSWKQALTFLLTSRGIPQIYYGTEILMYGTKANGGDANIRLDMPGGFPGDSTTVFTREGRSAMQNEAYDYLSQLLKWRKSPAANDVIALGSLTHFVPVDGVYVYARRLGDKQVIVLLNGSDRSTTVDTENYAELLTDGNEYKNIFDGTQYTLSGKIELTPRASLVLANF